MQLKLLSSIAKFTPRLTVIISPSIFVEDAYFESKLSVIRLKLRRPTPSPSFLLHQSNISCCPQLSNRELIILAHEYGHFLSKYNGFHTMDLFNADVNPNLKHLLLEEEKRAWNYAQEILESIGFEDFNSFHIIKHESLRTYDFFYARA